MKRILFALLVIVFGFNGYGQSVPCYVPTSGLVAWYPFTGNAIDSSSHGNNLTNVGGVTYGVDRFGNANSAAHFDGISQYLVNNSPNLPTGNSNRTVSLWYSNEGGGDSDPSLFGMDNGTSGGCYSAFNMCISNPLSGFYFWGRCNDKFWNQSSSLNTWYHLVLVNSNDTLYLYFNNTLVSSTLYLMYPFNTDILEFMIGNGLGDAHGTTYQLFNGKIDDIAIYNRALTPCEISNLYNASCASVTAGTITGSSSVCSGSNLTLTDATAGGSWSSSNTAVATVGSTGVVSGVSGGTATISYTVSNACGSATATKVVTVNAALNNYIITTIAGNGTAGYSGDGGAATAASFQEPLGVTIDNYGNVIVGGNYNNVIRKISTTGIISAIAGNGTAGFSGDGGPATAATLNLPTSTAIDSAGNIYIADAYNYRIRKISSTNIISTIAGNGILSFSGDGGSATSASIGNDYGLTTDFFGNIFICDNQRIRKIDAAGIISTYAGIGTAGFSGDGGLAISAQINAVTQVVFDASGNAFIADQNNNRIRKVNSLGIISTVAGNGIAGFSGDGGAATVASLNAPTGVAVDSLGNIYIADQHNHRIRKISSSGIISTIAGNGSAGFSGDGGIATAANLNNPWGIALDNYGNLYFSDVANNRIRKITLVNSIPSISGASSLCQGSNTTLSDTASGGSWSSSNTSIATVSTAGVVTGVSAGTTTISYTIMNACGAASATKVITVNPLPTAISGSSSVCVGANTTLTDASAGGTWSSSSSSATVGSSSGTVAGVSAGSTTITYTLPTGCKATKAVTVNPLPTAGTISGLSSVCVSATTTLTDATTGGTWSSSSSNATVGSTAVVTGVTAGTATISYTVTTGCGSASATQVITVNPLPNAGSISGASSLCITATTTLTDATAGGAWSSSSTSVATISSAGLVTGVASGTTTISYTVTTVCGTASATKTVSVNAAPSAGSISGSATVCPAGSITLTDAVPGGTWSSSNTSVATVGTSGSVTGVTAGTAIISYAVGNTCGTNYATQIVTVTASASAGTVNGSSSVCVSATITLTDATTGGTWSASNANATVGSTGVVTGVTAGTTNITYTVTTGCGTATATKTVTINPLPNAGSVTGASVVCTGSNAALTDAAAGGVWYASNSNAIVSSAGLVYGMSAGVDTITYQVTNSCGTATATRSVTVNPSPAAGTITGGSTVCAASTVALTDAISGGNWSSSGTTIATVGSAGLVTGILAGTATISYSVTNSCGTATATQLVTVNPLPIAGSILGSSTVCAGSNITLSDVSAGGVWSASNGNAVVSSGLVYGLTAGVDTISYAITNSCGTATATAVITINPLPTAGTIAGLSSVCPGANITLTDGATGGTWSATNGNASVAAGLVTGVTAGLDTVVYTVTNGCGTATATRVITINNTTLAGTITGASTICNGGNTTLSDAVAGGVWSATNGNAFVNSYGVVLALSIGVDTINYNVTGACGSATATTVITINPLPSAGSISGSSSVCAGSTITLSDAVSGGVWTSSSSAVATVGSTGVVSGVASGATTISYAVTNSCGTAYASIGILVNPLPVAGTITGVDTVCMGHSITLSDAVSGGVWTTVTGHATISSTGLLTGLTYGLDTVVYTVSNACGSTMATLPVMVRQTDQCNGTAVINVDLITNVQVKPNPNKGLFTVTGTIGNSPDGVVTIEVTSMLGQSVYKKQVLTQDNKLNQDVQLSNTTANGMYLLSIRSGVDVKVFHIVVEQ